MIKGKSVKPLEISGALHFFLLRAAEGGVLASNCLKVYNGEKEGAGRRMSTTSTSLCGMI